MYVLRPGGGYAAGLGRLWGEEDGDKNKGTTQDMTEVKPDRKIKTLPYRQHLSAILNEKNVDLSTPTPVTYIYINSLKVYKYCAGIPSLAVYLQCTLK